MSLEFAGFILSPGLVLKLLSALSSDGGEAMKPFRKYPALIAITTALLCGVVLPRLSQAQSLKDAVGYTQLKNELGGSLPTGAGVRVGLVEADTDASASIVSFLPQTSSAEFSGKSFTTIYDPLSTATKTVSGHATGVASNFFGNTTSLAPGVSSVDLYEANDFVDRVQNFGGGNPALTNVSVMNHSYIGFGLTTAETNEVNARLDYTVTRDNFTSVVALNNGVGSVPQLYGQTYNSIVVGRSDGQHSYGNTAYNVAGRMKPDIVAPQGSTSMATPVVSSAAALLHAGAIANSMADARNSESIKAMIMAGATKSEFPSWSNSTTRPLDTIYGAGELNVYNSYKILLGGEHAGSLTEPTQSTSLRGWDYESSFTPASTLYWNFDVTAGQEISEASILLTWNAQFKDALGNFSLSSFSLANMDMRFYNSTSSFLGTQLAASLSTVDNVEHIYLKNLAAGKYTLAVTSNVSTAFGLAWNLVAVPEPGSIALVSLALVSCIMIRKRGSDSADRLV